MRKRSFEYFCDDFENIENYELAKADNFKGWCCHHRLETHNSDGERRLVDIFQKELIALGMYFHRPPEELIFMTRKEHALLHAPMKGKRHSEEWKRNRSDWMKSHPMSEEIKRKISETLKGKHHSDEWKRNISESMKGRRHSEECKRKISESHKGKKRGPYKLKMRHWKLVDGKRVYY